MSSQYDMTPYDPSREQDFWADSAVPGAPVAPAMPARASAPARPADPMERLRRLLRGRTTMAIVLAVAGAIFGAAVGWWSQTPVYEAVGSVEIPPNVPVVSGDEPLPGYRQFMHTEANYIGGLEMAKLAMEQPVWKQAAEKRGGDGVSPISFAVASEATYNEKDSLIRVFFRHDDAHLTMAGARALVAAYEDIFNAKRSRVGTGRIEALEAQIARLTGQQVELEQQMEQKRASYGSTELDDEHERLLKERANQQDELFRITHDLDQALNQRELVTADPSLLPVTDLVRYDPDLAALAAARNDLLGGLRALQRDGFGPNHRSWIEHERRIKDLEVQIEEFATVVRRQYFGEVPNLVTGAPVHVTPTYIRSLEDRRAHTDMKLAQIGEALNRVSQDAVALATMTRSVERINEQMLDLNDQINKERQNQNFQEQLGTVRAHPPLDGTLGEFQDKRPEMAVGGAIMGLALPLALVMLLGLLDSRFRYSEDAADAGGRVTLLGILPNLPDRLSDPNQASIAAHCVHQIRTILQINHGSDESRAFAVTSASRGDGKTSLALALGLSYAASGARTLLVDTDLQHGGLSARLGVAGDEGIMDALTGGDLMEYVCETDVPDLAILPIGRGAANHAGVFSPAAVRHLLEQAKRHYDVVVCDTGPILGSIESTPIASAVDGVVLTVSRGQSRPLVSKALAHLESVGATVAGLVFNRAQASDFERSVSGMNLRNGLGRVAARTNGHGGRNVLSQN